MDEDAAYECGRENILEEIRYELNRLDTGKISSDHFVAMMRELV